MLNVNDQLNPEPVIEDIEVLQRRFPHAKMIGGILIDCGPIEGNEWDDLVVQHPDESYCLECNKWVDLQNPNCH